MAFILSQPVEPLSHAVPPSHLSHPLDVTQAFGLIDRILPFEACLYHEIIPLFLENRTLHLGMVTLTDVPALDYARKILLFLNYTLIPQIISTDLHRQVLSQYLQFKGQADPCIEDQTVFYEAEECAPLQPLRSATVQVSSPSKIPPRSPIDRETLIVETPEAIDDWLMDWVKPGAKYGVEPVVKEVRRSIDRQYR